jgi:hypothetical protein
MAKTTSIIRSVEIFNPSTQDVDLYEVGDTIQSSDKEDDEETINSIDVENSNGIIVITLFTMAYQDEDNNFKSSDKFKKIMTTSRVDINYDIVEA